MIGYRAVRRVVPKTRTARLVLGVMLVLVVLAVVFRSTIGTFLGIIPAQAAGYQMQTGYYIGDGASKQISGLGFSPEAVIIQVDNTSGSGAILKTVAMPQNNVAYLGSATADNTAAQIQFTDDGFIVTGTLTNSINARFTWIAFTGSDCSVGGQFCVGSYTGDGLSTKNIYHGI